MGDFCGIPKYLSKNFLREITTSGYPVKFNFNSSPPYCLFSACFSLLSFNPLDTLLLYWLSCCLHFCVVFLFYGVRAWAFFLPTFFLFFQWNCLMLNGLWKIRVNQVTCPLLFQRPLWPLAVM